MANHATLQIGDLKFIIEQSFSDGYKNNFEIPPDLYFRTHPSLFIWKGGEFKPTAVAINLVVDKDGNVSTPQELVDVLAKIVSYALSPANLGPDPITVKVGNWYRRTGYINDLDITFHPPWDISTGMPMKAEVRFTLLPDFLYNFKAGDVKDSTKTPRPKDFKSMRFLTMGGSSGGPGG